MAAFRSARDSTTRTLVRWGIPTLSLMAAFLLVCNISGEKRPGKHPEFGDGFRAFKQEEWATVADRMLAALAVWPEDGGLTRVYGRWFEPYIPRYYLGVALYELGCYELSLAQLEESVLGKEEVKGAKKQLEELESLKLKSERFVRQGITESEDAQCADWSERIKQPEKEEDR